MSVGQARLSRRSRVGRWRKRSGARHRADRDRRPGSAAAAPSAAGAHARGGGWRPRVARACALLSERHLLPPRTASTSSDLLSAIDGWHAMPPHVQRVADDIARTFPLAYGELAGLRTRAREGGKAALHAMSDERFLRAVLSGYPDRVAQRREPGSPNVLLASGTGATIARESGVRDGEFLVALDVRARIRNPHQSAIRHPQSGLRGPQAA